MIAQALPGWVKLDSFYHTPAVVRSLAADLRDFPTHEASENARQLIRLADEAEAMVKAEQPRAA